MQVLESSEERCSLRSGNNVQKRCLVSREELGEVSGKDLSTLAVRRVASALRQVEVAKNGISGAQIPDQQLQQRLQKTLAHSRPVDVLRELVRELVPKLLGGVRLESFGYDSLLVAGQGLRSLRGVGPAHLSFFGADHLASTEA